MEKFIINGKEISEKTFLRSLMYGEGVFETLRYKGKLPTLIDEHYNRLVRGLKLLSIPVITKEDFLDSIESAVKDMKDEDLYVKVVVFGEGLSYYPLKSYKSNILVVVKPFKPVDEEIKLTVSPYRIHSLDPLVHIKSTNYLRNILIKRFAREKGYFDAIILNENSEITETSSANIYWVKGKYLYTPSLDCGVLAGISRKVVLENAKREGFVVVEGRFSLKDLKNADMIFISNSLHGLMRVSNIDL